MKKCSETLKLTFSGIEWQQKVGWLTEQCIPSNFIPSSMTNFMWSNSGSNIFLIMNMSVTTRFNISYVTASWNRFAFLLRSQFERICSYLSVAPFKELYNNTISGFFFHQYFFWNWQSYLISKRHFYSIWLCNWPLFCFHLKCVLNQIRQQILHCFYNMTILMQYW